MDAFRLLARRVLLLALLAVPLAGCRSLVEAYVEFDVLEAKQPRSDIARLSVAVDKCVSSGASESSAVRLIRAEISRIIPKAKFAGCEDEKGESVAKFEIPVVVGAKDDKSISFYADESAALKVYLPFEIQQALANAPGSIGAYCDVMAKVALINRTKKERIVTVQNAFFDGDPRVSSEETITTKFVHFLIPSNVTIRYLVLTGEAPLLK